MPSKSHTGCLMVKTSLVLTMVEVEGVNTQLTLMSMEERGSLVCLEEVAVESICWGLLQIGEESLDLMENVVENPSLSTAVYFEEYLEEKALKSTASVSFAVIHSY